MNQTNRPLVRALQLLQEQNPVSFHVPGHKHGHLSNLPSEMQASLSFDFTELTGLDDLHEAEGVIREAESLLSSLYQSNRSFFLINGSTVGNLAMIYAACQADDTIIVQRNAHKSVFHAIELTGARPVLISPQWDAHTRTPGVLTPDQVERALAAHPHAKAIVLTYPTYYGIAGERLGEIIDLCHSRSVPVLVDEAHGAHFIIGEPFPHSAIEMGADVVVHSAHKTLPAMTMGSFLHVRSKLISEKKIAHYLQMLQSSSPSYIIMASLDDARAYAASYKGNDKRKFMELRSSFIQELKEINHLEIVETDDPLKLLIRAEGHSGFALQAALEAEGIYVELADPYQVLFIVPLWNEQSAPPLQAWKEKMVAAVTNLGKVEEPPISISLAAWPAGISTLAYPPSALPDMETEWISMDEAEGRIAAASVIPYPPGIPLLIKGEEIKESHIQALSALTKAGARFQGTVRLAERELFVLKRRSEESNMSKGKFITFEGPEGAGKTTVIAEIYKRLEAEGKKAILTREPGGIRISEKIREIIHDNEHQEMDGMTEALLYAAARRQHLVERIIPAMDDGRIVLCDRFIDSSLAYQGYARGLGMEEVMTINSFAIGETMPDLTIFFDISPEEGLKRISNSGEREQNRLDNETLQFHQKVYEGYELLLQKYPNRIIKTDASKPLSEVTENVWKIISSQLINEQDS